MSVAVVCANCGYENSQHRRTCKKCHQPLLVSVPSEELVEENDVKNEMSEYKYLVVPFLGKLKRGVFDLENATKVSKQLQDIIDQYTSKGWDFYRIDKVNILVQPGCIAGLLGIQASFLTFDQVIFRVRRP